MMANKLCISYRFIPLCQNQNRFLKIVLNQLLTIQISVSTNDTSKLVEAKLFLTVSQQHGVQFIIAPVTKCFHLWPL